MKKIIILTLILLFGFSVGSASANESDTALLQHGFVFTAADGATYDADVVSLENNGIEAVFTATGAPFSGVARYFDNDQLVAETPYVRGKAHGTVKTYHPNGTVSRTTPYVNGKIEGLEKVYNDKGRIVDEISYIDNVIDGEWKHLDQATNIWTIDIYKNGEKVSAK